MVQHVVLHASYPVVPSELFALLEAVPSFAAIWILVERDGPVFLSPM